MDEIFAKLEEKKKEFEALKNKPNEEIA